MNVSLSAIGMALAVALGFGCALGLASMWLRAMVGALTRNSYNVTNAPDSVGQAILPNATYFYSGRLENSATLGSTGFSRCSSSSKSDAPSRGQAGQLPHVAQTQVSRPVQIGR